MTEREVQAQLHPHTGQVEVSEDRWQMAAKTALAYLDMIAAKPEWPRGMPAVVAKNGIEQVQALVAPSNVTYEFTYDHAGPDY